MRTLHVVAAGLLGAAAGAGSAFAVGDSGGQVRVEALLSYAIQGVSGTYKVELDGDDAALDVGASKGSVFELKGSWTDVKRPFLGSGLTLDYAMEAPIGSLSERKAKWKVPALGDIPVLGGVFSAKKEIEARTNLVVLITPFLVRDMAPKAPFVEIGGTVDVTSGSIRGSVTIDRTFSRYTGSDLTKFRGTITSGPNAGKTVRGKLKTKVRGDRVR